MLEDKCGNDDDVAEAFSEPLSDLDDGQRMDEGFVDDNDEQTVGLVPDVFLQQDGNGHESSTGQNSGGMEQMEGPSIEESVGPDNIEGFQKVTALASFLVTLADSQMALTNIQADEIIRLWNDLDDYDKQPTVFSPRHKEKLVKGRFKSPKKRTNLVVPGLDSTKRCFLGSSSGPAQWPDCNRYVEAVISQLCNVHPGPDRSGGTTTARWTLVCRSYKCIRERVANNAKVMKETNIQLVEINQATLSQWYNKRQKKMEQDVLKQGIRLPLPDQTSEDPLPSATPLPSSLPQVDFPIPFSFVMPENTTEKGKVKGFRTAPPPPPSTPPALLPQSIQPQPILPVSTPTPPQNRSQFYYQKRKAEKEASGTTVRKYQPSSKPITCGKCKQARDPATHRQYFGNWYCQASENETFESWREALKEKKEYKKKKQ